MSALFNLKSQTPLFAILADKPRRLPAPLPVWHIGFIPHNRYPRRTVVHRSLSLGFILSGAGSSGPPGRVRAIRPPCLNITTPGVLNTSWPNPEWMEFFISYEPWVMDRFRRLVPLRQGRNEWPLTPLDRVANWIVRILEEMKRLDAAGSADRIDRLAELLILDVVQPSAGMVAEPAPDPGVEAVDSIRRTMDEQAAERPVDWRALARDAGLSDATFRRVWRRRYAVPPAHYLMQRRIEEACRLLSETGLPIKEIAARLQFADQLYFCKRFHRFIGCSPSQYRERGRSSNVPRPGRGHSNSS